MSFLDIKDMKLKTIKTKKMTEKKTGKGRNILSLAGIVLMLTIAISSCKKEDEFVPGPQVVTVTPANNGMMDAAAAIDLKWGGATATRYNIYFGEQSIPTLYKSSVTEQTLNVPVTGGHTYYWQIGTINADGKESLSQVYTFKVKVSLDLDKFTGKFDCDEPKYAHYDVNMTRAGKDTLFIDNFWDLKWKLGYVFDEMGNVKIVPATFSPDPSLKVSVSGTGTFDTEKNKITVNYVVLQDASVGSPLAIEIDRNTHTYVRK